METDKNIVYEKLLNLSLEITCLLTGEDYTVVKKACEKDVTPSRHCSVSGGWSRNQSPIMEPPPPSLIPESNKEQKILELTNKMIELLTGEVPIRCQDVTVYFSMEEWEYLEGHKDLYKEVMMDDHQTLTSPVECGNKNHNEESISSAASLSYLKHEVEEMEANVLGITEESKSRSMEEVIKMTQCPPINIDEKPPCDRGNLTESDIHQPVDHTMHGSPPCFIGEPFSCNGNFPNCNVMGQTPQYPSTYIKEEPMSCGQGNLLDSYIPKDHTQQYSSPYIKEDPVLCNRGNLIDMSTHTDHTQLYPTTHIKEEPSSCEEDLTDSNSYTPTDPTQQYATSYIKEEPGSSDGGNFTHPNVYTLTDRTQQQPSRIKEEPVWSDRGNLIGPNDDTQQPSSYIKEEPVLSYGENLTNCTQQHPSPYIRQEPISSDGGNLTDPKNYTSSDHSQYLFPHIMKEPVSCNGVSPIDLGIHATIDRTRRYRCTPMKRKADSYNGETADCTVPMDKTQLYPRVEPLLEKAPSLQIHESLLSGKPVGKNVSEKKNGEPEENSNEITDSSKKYFCTVQQTTDSLEILYHCPECPECFRSNLDLAKHQIIHTGVMPFVCSVCGRCFRKKRDLVIHQSMHGGSNDFGCPQCELSFATKSSLSNHERTHVMKNPLPCPECGKAFPTKKRLTRHRITHTNERPFECPECGDWFKRKAHLQRHQTIHQKARQQVTCNVKPLRK